MVDHSSCAGKFVDNTPRSIDMSFGSAITGIEDDELRSKVMAVDRAYAQTRRERYRTRGLRLEQEGVDYVSFPDGWCKHCHHKGDDFYEGQLIDYYPNRDMDMKVGDILAVTWLDEEREDCAYLYRITEKEDHRLLMSVSHYKGKFVKKVIWNEDKA